MSIQFLKLNISNKNVDFFNIFVYNISELIERGEMYEGIKLSKNRWKIKKT